MLFWLSETGQIWGFQAFSSCSVDFPHYGDPLAEIGHIWGFWALSGEREGVNVEGRAEAYFRRFASEFCLVFKYVDISYLIFLWLWLCRNMLFPWCELNSWVPCSARTSQHDVWGIPSGVLQFQWLQKQACSSPGGCSYGTNAVVHAMYLQRSLRIQHHRQDLLVLSLMNVNVEYKVVTCPYRFLIDLTDSAGRLELGHNLLGQEAFDHVSCLHDGRHSGHGGASQDSRPTGHARPAAPGPDPWLGIFHSCWESNYWWTSLDNRGSWEWKTLGPPGCGLSCDWITARPHWARGMAVKKVTVMPGPWPRLWCPFWSRPVVEMIQWFLDPLKFLLLTFPCCTPVHNSSSWDLWFPVRSSQWVLPWMQPWTRTCINYQPSGGFYHCSETLDFLSV